MRVKLTFVIDPEVPGLLPLYNVDPKDLNDDDLEQLADDELDAEGINLDIYRRHGSNNDQLTDGDGQDHEHNVDYDDYDDDDDDGNGDEYDYEDDDDKVNGIDLEWDVAQQQGSRAHLVLEQSHTR